MPTSIVIPSGQTSISFPLSAVDDNLLDGTQSLELRASAAGYVSGTRAVEVRDAEQITLSLSKSSVAETAGRNAPCSPFADRIPIEVCLRQCS